MKILVVDDSSVMRKILVRAMRQAGYGDHTIVEAGDGVEGLAAVESESPDLILSDWNMPNLNGMEFLTKLRAGGTETPFGFITTEGGAEMRAKADAAGANFLLSKPFEPNDIVTVMDKYL